MKAQEKRKPKVIPLPSSPLGSVPGRLAKWSRARECESELGSPAQEPAAWMTWMTMDDNLWWQLFLRDKWVPGSRLWQGNLSPTHRLFFYLISTPGGRLLWSLSLARDPSCCPPSTLCWLVLAHSILFCPFSCFSSTVLQETGPQS